jgi:hypothetical protein
MKTTIEIQSELLRRAKAIARREGKSLRALVEEGLRHVVAERSRPRRKRRFRMVTVKGGGLQPGIDPSDWRKILEISYRGRVG